MFKAGHIEGAILIDVTEKDFLAKADSLLDKSRPVAVYCRSGRRSRRAAEMLVEKGYTVHNLNEGYHEWRLYQEGKKTMRIFPSSFFSALADGSYLEQVFGNLYRVQSRSLFDLVADRPER